jgi:hypothetical protein
MVHSAGVGSSKHTSLLQLDMRPNLYGNDFSERMCRNRNGNDFSERAFGLGREST